MLVEARAAAGRFGAPQADGTSSAEALGHAELLEIADRQDQSGPGGCFLSFRLGHCLQRCGLYCGTCSAASLSSGSL